MDLNASNTLTQEQEDEAARALAGAQIEEEGDREVDPDAETAAEDSDATPTRKEKGKGKGCKWDECPRRRIPLGFPMVREGSGSGQQGSGPWRMARKAEGEPFVLQEFVKFDPLTGPFPPSDCECLGTGTPTPASSAVTATTGAPASTTTTAVTTTTTSTTTSTATTSTASSGRTHVNQFRIYSANNCYNNPYLGSGLPPRQAQGGVPPHNTNHTNVTNATNDTNQANPNPNPNPNLQSNDLRRKVTGQVKLKENDLRHNVTGSNLSLNSISNTPLFSGEGASTANEVGGVTKPRPLMDIRVPPPQPPRNPAAAAAAAAAERRAAGAGAGTVNPPPGPPAQPRDHQPTAAAARPPPGPSAPPRDRQPTQGQPEASRKEGAETKERRKESRAEAAAVISSLYGIAPGQPNPDHASPAFREALTITGHLPTVDLLVLGRTLMNPDNGFRRFWDQFREMEFGPGERGRRAREEAKDELRKLASRWLMTAAEKKRRRLTGPNGDRNARGRHFFHHLRLGVILSDAELDSILAQSHKDSARGIRSSPATLTNRQPPAALVAPSPRHPTQVPEAAQAQGEERGGTDATPTPTAGPSSSGNPAEADATPNPPRPNLRARLDARTAPLVPPQPGGSRASSRGRGTSGTTDRRSRGPSPTQARAGSASGNPLTYPNNIEHNSRNSRKNNPNQTTQVNSTNHSNQTNQTSQLNQSNQTNEQALTRGGGQNRVAGTDSDMAGSGHVEASSASGTRGGNNVNGGEFRGEELEEGEIADDPPPNQNSNQNRNFNSNQNRQKNKRNKNKNNNQSQSNFSGQGGRGRWDQVTPSTSTTRQPPPTAATGATPRTRPPHANAGANVNAGANAGVNAGASTSANANADTSLSHGATNAATTAVATIAPRMVTRYDDDGNEVTEPEVDRVIITERGGNRLEGQDLNVAMEATMDLVETDQGSGRRVIAFEAWNRTRGHLGVTPTDGPQTAAGRASARDSGEALIHMADGLTIPTVNDGRVALRARWSSQLPRVSNWSVRYQGVARDPRALIESPIRGIGVMNALSEAARREIRFVSSHGVGQTSQDTIIRFEVGETAAREIQAVIRNRGGQIRIGATSTRVQHNRQDVTADSHIVFNLQY